VARLLLPPSARPKPPRAAHVAIGAGTLGGVSIDSVDEEEKMNRKMLTPLAFGCAALLSIAACGGDDTAADTGLADTGMGAMPAPAPAPAPATDTLAPTDTLTDTTRRDTTTTPPPPPGA
jgi:hypothetical protein